MQRRQLLRLASGGIAALCLRALAQTGQIKRIGFFSGGTAQSNAGYLRAFREGMAALRWVEGRDYAIDARYANAVASSASGLVAELVAGKPDLLLATGNEATRLFSEKSKTIPIVFAAAQDPVGSKLAASLQRPGGNATGLASLARELAAKRLQLLKEAFPRVAHVVLLYEPGNLGSASQVKDMDEAAASLKLRLTPIELRLAADIEPAFKRGAALGAQAYMVAQGSLVNSQSQAVVDGTVRAKVPAIFAGDQYVEAGGLMSYAASFTDNFRRAAGYVDKILKGARAGELPIEQATLYELVLNLKTAKAMKLTIPQEILLRADRVIE